MRQSAKVLCRPSECFFLSKHTLSWPGLVMLPSAEALCRASACSILSKHTLSWPRLVMLPQKNDHFWPGLVMRQSAKHSVGRQSALSYRSIPFLGQDWLCSRRRMTILGQDWSYLDLKRNICRLSLPIRRNNPIIYHQDLHFFGKKTAFPKKDIIFAF